MSTTITEKPVFDASRYHSDQRPYKVAGGLIPQQGINAAWDYLYALNWMDVDGRTTEQSYSRWLDTVQEALTTVTSTSSVREIVDSVRYNSRMSPGSILGLPAQGHTIDDYKKNAVEWFGKCRTFFNLVKAYREDNSNRNLFNRVVLSYIGNEWLVTGKGEYVGTYPKRLAKALFKICKIRLRPEHLQVIGDLISQHTPKEPTEIVLAFDQDFIEGSSPRDYCHADSCWWGDSRTGLREGFVAEGGWAVRQFEGRTPVSRCWIVWDKHHECYVLFNAYGRTDLSGFARVLSAAWGLSYAQAPLFPDRDEYFINGSKCYLMGTAQLMDKLSGSDINVQWHEPIKPKVTCGCCKEGCDRDDLRETQDRDNNWIMVCGACSTLCVRCNRRHTHDAMSEGTEYCRECVTHMHPCGCCSALTDETYCRTCVARYNLVDRYEVDWDAMTYRFIPAQLPPHASAVTTSGTTASTAATTTVG